jgi:hypothetical protein
VHPQFGSVVAARGAWSEQLAQLGDRQFAVAQDRAERALRDVPVGVYGDRGCPAVLVLEPVMTAAYPC